MLDIDANRPVDPVTCEVLSLLNTVFAEEGINYFLVGATARDLLMYHVFGIKSGRATNDVDFAVALETWEQFKRVNARLMASNRFSKGADMQRLYFDTEKYAHGYPVDLIPFGAVARADSQIAWPPDGHIVMNVMGYEEAFQTALAVRLTPDIVTRTAAIPALAGLKLLSWKDRMNTTSRDAQDLFFLLKNYTNAGNTDRIYNEASGLLDACDYDIDLAGAALLGFDCRVIMGSAVVETMHSIIQDKNLYDKLVLHMAGTTKESSEQAGSYLKLFSQGLNMETLK